jgi:hypothetical protein
MTSSNRSQVRLTALVAATAGILPSMHLADSLLSNHFAARPPNLAPGEVLRVASPVEPVSVRRELVSTRGPGFPSVSSAWFFEDQHGREVLVPLDVFPKLHTGDVLLVTSVAEGNLFVARSFPSAGEIREGQLLRSLSAGETPAGNPQE